MARGDCNMHNVVDLMGIMPEGTGREITELASRGNSRVQCCQKMQW